MWKDLERPVAIIEEEPISATAVNDEEVALRIFKKALDDSGYAFNERTIKAFHTGLLCGGTSPLVVLSGISGTGKSLLPELYAKAFNMNFLPVAVQPRWDGPQDVFGFYNHMEGRFKATELSRLIYQFDVFNNDKAAKMYGASDEDQFPMSLVLLDEMNLARVEYYFSELLSKLEIRNRVIDPRIKEDRKPSEIELEYGASSVADEDVARSLARRLFVGHNILFVGTMNEDESTQTLSSKVIDRSNVLRFGTPESLTRAPDAKKFIEKCNNFVSYKTWKKWAKPYGNSLVGLEDRISELKEALKLVDRGFGHRTESAIKQYVDFYPGSKQDALADQIEMKILPKLNGVESDLVRDKVQNMIVSVLHSIHDTDVSEALTETLNSESTFFTWKGVRR
jgi:5-methylcytosine-specific restriction endonuclease McrBC GTP-binding regulatory subunit McrB